MLSYLDKSGMTLSSLTLIILIIGDGIWTFSYLNSLSLTTIHLSHVFPLFFYYGSVVLTFRFLKGGLYGLGGAATILLSNGLFTHILTMPYLANAFFFPLVAYLIWQLVNVESLRQEKNLHIWLSISLITYAILSEGAILAIALLVMLMSVYKGLSIFRERLISGAMAISGLIISVKIWLYFQAAVISLGDDKPIDLDVWDQVFSGIYVREAITVFFDFDRLQILPAAIAVPVLIGGLLFSLKNTEEKSLKFVQLSFFFGLLLCLFFGVVLRAPMSSPYLLYLYPLWVILLWHSVRSIAGWIDPPGTTSIFVRPSIYYAVGILMASAVVFTIQIKPIVF